MQLRTPPHDESIEKAFLGAIILNPNSIVDVSNTIKSEYFYNKINGIVYSALLNIHKRLEPIDTVSVVKELKDTGNLDDVGGSNYIVDIISNVPYSGNIEYYAKIILDKYTLRKLILAGESIVDIGFSDSRDVDSAVESATSKILAVKSEDTKEQSDISDVISEFDSTQKQFMEKQFSGKLIGIPSGFSKIDNAIDGLRPGHFWSIAGYTSSGKTQFLLNIINNLIEENQVTLFSLEMSKTDIISRLLAIETGIGMTKIMRHEFQSPEEIDKFTKARERLVNSKFKIYSKTSTLDGIILSMTRDMLRNNTKVFAIDYVQLVRTGSKSEYEQITETAQRLQTFARETGCTIIVLSQVSNEHARDPNQEVHGTKGGGSLPASVDLAIELFNEDKKEERDDKVTNGQHLNVRAIIKKNRHGRCGYVSMDFTPWNGKFSESVWDI